MADEGKNKQTGTGTEQKVPAWRGAVEWVVYLIIGIGLGVLTRFLIARR